MTPSAVIDAVAALGVQWLRRPVPDSAPVQALLALPALDAAQSACLVDAVAPAVADERAAHGYLSQDLVVLHPGTPGLDDALARFDRAHTHGDDEVRYILDGEGLFGFFDATGAEHVVRVQASDYLRVPAGVEHRFTLTPTRRIKALRLFTDAAGWAALYTGRPVGVLLG